MPDHTVSSDDKRAELRRAARNVARKGAWPQARSARGENAGVTRRRWRKQQRGR